MATHGIVRDSVPVCRFLALCWLLWVGVSTAPAQDELKPRDGVTEFYRLFVPRKDVASVAKQYLPMDREELTKKLRHFAARQTSASVPLARLQKARYTLQFSGETLRGTAHWSFATESTIKSDTWVSLAPARLAISQAVWEPIRDSDRSGRLAATGMQFGANDAGELGVIIREPGTLTAEWSARERILPDGSLEFHVSLPWCAESDGEITLPAGWEVAVSGKSARSPRDSILTENGSSASRSGVWDDRAHPMVDLLPGDDRSRRRWNGAGGEMTFVFRRSAGASSKAIESFSQESQYQIGLGGIEWRAELDLRMRPVSARTTEIEFSPSVSIVEVRSGTTRLLWNRLPARQGESPRIVIEWPEELATTRRLLQIQAIAPFPLSKPTSLPQLRPVAASWRQHLLTVRIDSRLVLRSLATRQCAQIEPLDTRPREATHHLRFVAEAEDAAVELAVERAHPEVNAEVGTHITVERSMLRGTARIQVTTKAGEIYTVPLATAAPWRIDSIDCDPPDRLEAIEVQAAREGRWRATIRLQDPITPENPLSITLHCHHPAIAKLTTATFRAVELAGIPTNRYVAIDVADGLAMETRGDSELERVISAEMSPVWRQLLPPDQHALAFVDDLGAEQLEVTVSPGEARYDTTTLVEATFEEGQLEEHFRIQCVPAETPISRVMLRMTPASGPEVSWRVISPTDVSLTIRQVALESAAGEQAGSPNMSQWELMLGREVRGPLVLEGRRARRLDSPSDATLIYLPHARDQQAEWALRVVGSELLGIAAQNVRELPLPTAGGDGMSLRSWFSYSGTGEARIELRPLSGSHPAVCWAAAADVVSEFDMQGRATHRIWYRVINYGLKSIRFQLPDSPTIIRATARVDESVVVDTSERPRVLEIELPVGRTGLIVELQLHTSGPSAIWRSSLEPVVPIANIPVLTQSWHVRLPESWDAVVDSPAESWRTRLGGPIATASQRTGSTLLRPVEDQAWWRRLEAALSLVARDAPITGPTWGEWLTAVGALPVSSGHPPGVSRQTGNESQIWVAAAALRLLGVTADTPLWRPNRDEEAVERIVGRRGLAWYEIPQGYLLAPLVPPTVAQRPIDGRERWVPLEAWTANPPPVALPWEQRSELDDRPLGGQVAAEQLVGGDRIMGKRLVVWHRSRRAGLLLGVWGIVAAAVGWRTSGRWRSWWILATAAAGVALLVPGAISPWLTAVWLGVLGGGLWASLTVCRFDAHTTLDPAGDSASVSLGSTGQVVAVLLLLLLVGWARAIADEPASETRRFAIVVPVDDEGKPNGTYDYIPRPLYEMLLRASDWSPRAPRGWLVRQADYHAAVTAQRNGSRLEHWVVTYDLSLFDSDAELALPAPPLPLETIKAEVSGIPVEVDWEMSDNRLRVRLGTTGVVRLVVECRAANNAPVEQKWELNLLPAPIATLQLSLPTDSGEWKLAGALGPQRYDTERGALTADLGMTDQIRLTFQPERVDESIVATRLAIEERWWLRIRPSAVVLDYEILGTVELPSVIVLDVDPRLQPLVLRADGYLVSVDGERDGMTQVRLSLGNEAVRRRTVRLRFLWRSREGIGRFRLPDIRPRELEPTQRSIAVSADPRLAVRWTGAPAPNSTPDDFLREWGDDEEVPRLVVQGDPELTQVELSTRLQPASAAVSADWSVHVGLQQLQWKLDLDWDVLRGWTLRDQVLLPPQLQVSTVLQLDVDTWKPVPFARAEDGTLTVFLDRPVSGNHRLRVEGFASWTNSGRIRRIALPQAAFSAAVNQSVTYHLWRDREVLVAPSGLDAIEQSLEPSWKGKPRGAWWMGSFRSSDLKQAGSLTLRPNRPRLRGWLVTHAFHESDRWWLEIVYGITVLNTGTAQLDAVRLEVPASWQDLRQVSPGLQWRWETGLDPARKRVLLIPADPITQPRVLRFVVPLAVGGSEQLRIPNIVPLDTSNVERYFVLPNRIAEGRVVWKTQGLFRRPLPERIQRDWSLPADRVPYRVVRGSQPSANIEQIRRRQGRAHVELADLLAVTGPRMSSFVVARYDLVAADRTRVDIVFPVGASLVTAQLNGRPARLERVSPDRWRLELLATGLPQYLELVCRVRPVGRTIEAPLLEGFAVRRTIWSVWSSSGETEKVRLQRAGDRRLTPAALAQLRLERTMRFVEQTLAQPWHGSSEALQLWYQDWAQRLWCLGAAKVHGSSLDSRHSPNWLMERFDRHIATVGSVDAVSVWDEIRSERPRADWQTLWSELLPPTHATAAVTSRGWQGRLEWEAASPAGRLTTSVPLIVTFIVAVVGGWLLRFPAAQAFFSWPSAWAWLAGLFAFFILDAFSWSVGLLAIALVLSLPKRGLRVRSNLRQRDDSRSRSASLASHSHGG